MALPSYKVDFEFTIAEKYVTSRCRCGVGGGEGGEAGYGWAGGLSFLPFNSASSVLVFLSRY